MKKHRRRRLLLVAVILIAFFIVYCIANREDVLPKYIEEETVTEEVEEIKMENIAPVSDENFRISIPTGMKVIDDGNIKYFLSDNINIMIEKYLYTHEISTYTADTYANTLSGNVNMMSFSYPTTSSRLLSFRRTTDTDDTFNVVFSVWDRKHIINISYEIKSSDYEEYMPAIKRSVDSYVWESSYSIDERLCMVYSSYGNCDYAVPVTFSNISTNDMYAYQSETGDILLTLEIYENGQYLDQINNLSYADYFGKGKSGYTLCNYNNSKEEIYAESYYTDTKSNNIVYVYQKIIANGEKQYFITYYVYKKSVTKDVLGIINESFNYFSIR